MKKFKLASVFVLLCVCSSVFAQETKTDRAIRAVKELCLTGTQFDLKADAKGNLTLRKLLPGAEGAVSVNVRESSGAAAIFDEKIRQIADEDIRRCIQPYIKQIIDAILAENPQSNPQIIQYVVRVRDKDTHLPVQDAKISLEGQGVPLIGHTDSEGIYRFTVKPVNDAVRVRVEAKGYEVYNRFITLWPDNPSLEDIALVRLPELIPPRTDPEKEVPKGTKEPKPSVYDQNTNYNRGVSNMQAGRYDLAINDFSQVIIGNPNHINAYYNRGVSYQKTGQNDKAIDDFKKVLELSNDPKVRERAKYNLRILGVK